MSYLHFNGVVHRDIKAANLLVSKAGIVAIGDFGLAKEISTSLSEQSIVGTPHWCAFKSDAELKVGITTTEML